MTGNSIVSRFSTILARRSLHQPGDLHTLWSHPQTPWPFAHDPLTDRILDLLGPLAWNNLPERNLQRNWGQPTVPHAAFVAAFLLKLNEGLVSMGGLCRYLLEHPKFIWLFGFPASTSSRFDTQASLPTQRHLTHMLRTIPNSTLQFLLADSVRLICSELALVGAPAVDCISLDTKHIIAWVKENNPKAYIEGKRYDKAQQPAGDPDCKLGCKRRHNRRKKESQQPVGPGQSEWNSLGEYYWGYGSGVVVAKAPGWGEFVLAEMTQPFNQPDVSYFFPLMALVEQRLGRKPRQGTFDAAFDAFYVYEYFHNPADPGAFAAVPFSEKGGYKANARKFNSEGLPLCAAGLPMPLKFVYTDRTVTIIEHERGKYICPLQQAKPPGGVCPVAHKRWNKGGCTAMMPTSIGARLRYTLDRDSLPYKETYKQRTAVERINSQAVALGIERPHWRNQQAITNQNTLIYLLINLRLYQRIRNRQTVSN